MTQMTQKKKLNPSKLKSPIKKKSSLKNKYVKPVKRILKKTIKLTDEEKAAITLRRKIQAEESRQRKLEAQAKEDAILASIIEDKPPGYNLSGERRLIAAVFVQAINDLLDYPHPDLNAQHKYRRESPAFWSLAARKFVNAKNPDFCFYCSLIDLDPKATEEGIYRYVKNQLHIMSSSYKKAG